MCWESDRAHTCTHGTWGSLGSPPFAPRCHSFPLLCEFSLPSRTPRGSTKPVVYVHFISRLRSSEGGPGLLSQQRTTHHFLLSSLLLGLITESKHSGSMILLVSQGRLFIQFSPQHCTTARSFSAEWKKWEMGDSAGAQLVLICSLCWEIYLETIWSLQTICAKCMECFRHRPFFTRVPYLLISRGSVMGYLCFQRCRPEPLHDQWKLSSPPYNAATRSGRFSGLILDTNISTSIGMLLANNFNEKLLDFFFLNIRRVPIWGIWNIQEKKRCFCCIFNRAAQFNPTLTFKAQGLIPSPVKAFVWGSPSPLAPASPSLPCPPKAYWQIFTQDSS